MLKSASGLDSWQAEQCFVVIEGPRSSEAEQLTFNQRVGMSEFPGGTRAISSPRHSLLPLCLGIPTRLQRLDSHVRMLGAAADSAGLPDPDHTLLASRGPRVKAFRPPFEGRRTDVRIRAIRRGGPDRLALRYRPRASQDVSTGAGPSP